MDTHYSNQIKKCVAATLAVALLHGCGGGSAANGEGTSSGGHELPNSLIAQPESLVSPPVASPPPTEEVSVPSVADPGWTESEGVALLTPTSISGWSFSSQKSTSWSPGGLSLASIEGQNYVALDFDFGCTTSVITTRDTDCRNVVTLNANASVVMPATESAVVALTLRNVDAAAEFALRLRDSSGQTFQYPIQVRTIEQPDTTQWAKVRVPLRYPSIYWGGANNGVPSGNIVALSIVAAPRNSDSATLGLNSPRGRLEVKAAKYYPTAGLTYTVQANAPINDSGVIPSLEGRFAVAHSNFDLALLQKAKAAGFSVIRRDLLWDVVESSGSYSFTPFTSGAENLSSLSMKVLWILAYGHPDHGGAAPVSSADRTAYARFAEESARFWRTRPIKGFEIWNEPHLPAYWPSPDVNAYGATFAQAASAIKSVDSSIPVVSAGVAIDEPSYLFKLARGGYLAQANGIGIHPYRKDSFVTTSPSFKRTFTSPEMYANDRLITKQALASVGVTQPLWNTESGYSSIFFLDPAQYPDPHSVSARNRQGQLLLRQVLTQIALNEPLITVYRLMDKGTSLTDKEQNFGLLDSDGNEKPAYRGLKNMAELTSGKAFNGIHSDVPPGVHALRWSDSATKVVCMWIDTLGEDATISLAPDVRRVVNWIGQELPTPGRRVSISETSGPVYFVY